MISAKSPIVMLAPISGIHLPTPIPAECIRAMAMRRTDEEIIVPPGVTIQAPIPPPATRPSRVTAKTKRPEKKGRLQAQQNQPQRKPGSGPCVSRAHA